MSPLDFALALRSLGAGAGLARRLRDELRGLGLSPKAAEGLAQALPKGGPYSRQRLREATPAETKGLEELLLEADLAAIEAIGTDRPALALLLAERTQRRPPERKLKPGISCPCQATRQ